MTIIDCAIFFELRLAFFPTNARSHFSFVGREFIVSLDLETFFSGIFKNRIGIFTFKSVYSASGVELHICTSASSQLRDGGCMTRRSAAFIAALVV